MYIDLHTHSKGVSKCSLVSSEEIIDEKKRLGYDGVVLANHCQPWYYEPKDHKTWIVDFVKEYEKGKEYADKKNFPFFLAIEVTITSPKYGDYLLYGMTKEKLLSSPCFYTLTQKELYAYCKANDVLLIQAHPFRDGCYLGNLAYLDGIEINMSGGDLKNIDKVIKTGTENNLLITCGTDYHGQPREFGAFWVDDNVKNAVELAEFMRKKSKKTLKYCEKTFEYVLK